MGRRRGEGRGWVGGGGAARRLAAHRAGELLVLVELVEAVLVDGVAAAEDADGADLGWRWGGGGLGS